MEIRTDHYDPVYSGRLYNSWQAEDRCPICQSLIQATLMIDPLVISNLSEELLADQKRGLAHKVALALASHIYHNCSTDVNAYV